MPNPLYTYILDIYDLVSLGRVYGISTFMGYSMPNPLYTYIIKIYNLVGFYKISTLVMYLMSNPLYKYILNIYDFVCLGFMNYQPW